MTYKFLLDLTQYPDLAKKLETLARDTRYGTPSRRGNKNRAMRELIRKAYDELEQGQTYSGTERRQTYVNKVSGKAQRTKN